MASPAQPNDKKKMTKSDYSKLAKEEAAKKAKAAEEAEKQRLAQIEEARLIALKQAEEEERKKAHMNMLLSSEEDKKKDLMAWLKSIPLSQSCIKRIDRSFSDGALIAEIIHYYMPGTVNKREYQRYHSKQNKLGNWEALNMKVFRKLGMRLTRRQINNIINPYACGKFQKECMRGIFIYQLLFRIRDVLGRTNISVYNYRKEASKMDVNAEPSSKEVGCKKKSRRYRRKLTNLLEHPSYSRVELLLEKGFYDREGATCIQRRPVCCSMTSQCSRTSCIDCANPRCDDMCMRVFPCSLSSGVCTYYDCNALNNQICLKPALSYIQRPDANTQNCDF